MSNPNKLSPQDELASIELEMKRLQLETLREDIDIRKMTKQADTAIYRDRGVVLANTDRDNVHKRDACTHRKGGMGMEGLNGRGDDTDYAVFKMRWFDGRLWVRCLRCAKTWHPIRLQQFGEVKDGKLIKANAIYKSVDEAMEAFKTAEAEYRQACAFPTKNQPAGTSTYQFHTPEAREKYEQVHDNLSLA